MNEKYFVKEKVFQGEWITKKDFSLCMFETDNFPTQILVKITAGVDKNEKTNYIMEWGPLSFQKILQFHPDSLELLAKILLDSREFIEKEMEKLEE